MPWLKSLALWSRDAAPRSKISVRRPKNAARRSKIAEQRCSRGLKSFPDTACQLSEDIFRFGTHAANLPRSWKTFMARYDEATYDSGLRYDESTIGRRWNLFMAKAKLNVSSLNVQEALDIMQIHDQAMTGNANFATPEPTVVAFMAGRTALQDASLAYEAGKQALENLLEQRDAALADAKGMLVQRVD